MEVALSLLARTEFSETLFGDALRQLDDFFLETQDELTVPTRGLSCLFKNAHIK